MPFSSAERHFLFSSRKPVSSLLTLVATFDDLATVSRSLMDGRLMIRSWQITTWACSCAGRTADEHRMPNLHISSVPTIIDDGR
jgi:hypothetical protein